MADYYSLLNLDPSANAAQIRTAFKRLAMQYHPDRNAGDKNAEEQFKLINEAYHTLSDPLKKAKYDARFSTPYTAPEYMDAYWRDLKRRQRYAQAQHDRPYYRLDRNYFKIQALAFLTFLIIAGFCFAVLHTAYYIIEQRHLALMRENLARIKQVNALFGKGKFNDAFDMVTALKTTYPLVFEYELAKDSLLKEMKKMADQEYASHKFPEASAHYRVVQKYETPTRVNTLNAIAFCEYYQGNFEESIGYLKQVLHLQPWNMEIIHTLGRIYLENLNNPKEAFHYYTMGKKMFKSNLSETYGKAFELMINPAEIPDIYVEIFKGRAKAGMALSEYREAIKDCYWMVFLRPKSGEGYRMRALAKIALKNKADACDDLREAVRLNDPLAPGLKKKHCL